MPIYTWRVSTYAMDIYLFGNRTFQDAPVLYIEPIKIYAATGYVNGVKEDEPFAQAEIDNALAQNWITQQEYDDTMTYKNEV